MIRNPLEPKIDARLTSSLNSVFHYKNIDDLKSESKLPPADGKINFCELIVSYLKQTNQLNDITNRVTRAKSNIERIDVVYPIVEKEMQQLESIFEIPVKSNEISEKFLKEGNEFFNKQMYKEAFDKFLESIRYAVDDSEQLGLAFAHRSAVLYEMKLYKECVKDIDYASSYTYSEEMKQKHLQQKRNALDKKIGLKKVTEYYESIPEISVYALKNPVSDSQKKVKLSFDENNHLRLVAAKDINVGDIIFVEKAYTQCLLPTFRNRHCSLCTEISHNLIPCKNCLQEMYCSEKCREEAKQQYHKYECRLLDIAFNVQLSEKQIEALRAFIIGRDEYKNFNIWDLRNYVEDPTLSSHSLHLKDILHHVKLPNLKPEGLFRTTLETALTCYLVKNYSNFFENFHPNCRMEDTFKQITLNLVQILLLNNVSIKKYTESSHVVPVSCGVFPMLLMLKHACSPNVMVEFRAGFAVVRASLPIKSGEECNICKTLDAFGPLNHLMVTKYRRLLLKDLFQLNCNCIACTEDWDLIHFLPYAEKFESFVESSVSTIEQNPTRHNAKNFIPILVQFITDMKKRSNKTNRELEMSKYGLNLCFALLGNKDISDL